MSEKPKIIGVIPGRYGSSRFRGKIIAKIAGKPMVQRVYEQSAKSDLLDDLIVAVDDQRVFDVVQSFGGKVMMTASHHQSGTDRLAEVAAHIDGDIYVNIQGDQPILDPRMIDEAVAPMIDNPDMLMSTLKIKIEEDCYHDPGIVKVVTDKDGWALYFSRSLIPYNRDGREVDIFEHVGLYVYRKDFLQEYTKMVDTPLCEVEVLEQLKVLENGYRIFVVETKCDRISGLNVDTPEDLLRIENILLKQS
jgi:3-deoxy-manno-octulosonate cytidylyltransferase (CMP-KDO synthetase)